GAGASLLSRLRTWPLWCAALWVLVELLRARIPLGGFPWGRLAYASVDSPAVRLASLGGAPLVTTAVALSGCLLAWAVLARPTRPVRRLAAVGAAVGVAAGG